MFKRILLLSLFALLIPLVLAACAPAAQTTPSADAVDPPATEVSSPPTEADAKPTPTTITGPQMECTLVSNQSEAPAEFEAILGVKENDWVYGSETAAVTIVEYADFQ